MIILNLFSGVGADIMAWERTNLPPLTKVYHSEIDPFAISVDRFLHPQVIQLGDVQNIKGADLGYVDVILGGSPCQGFSYSGKQLAFDDPRSKLFFEFVRILNELREINPKINFFLENVKMKKEFRDVVTDQLGVHPIELNSALDSAQNRKRLYWASWGIMPQIDKGIMIGDILEDSDQADLVGKQGKVLLKENIDKASCLLARDYKGFGNQGQTGVKCIQVGHAEEIKGHDTIRRVYSPKGKAPTLTTMQGGNREPKVSMNEVRWRALTPIECERLMPMEDNSTLHGIDEKGNQKTISKTQRYKMLGNGWVVDTIAHCLKYLEGRI